MAQRFDLFTTPILTAEPPGAAALNGGLLEVIEAERARDPAGIHRSNIGGWHSAANMTAWGGEYARQLSDFAISLASGHMEDIAAAGKRDFRWGVDMWANINAAGQSNQLHCHVGAFWSAVYYVDPGAAAAPGQGGELVLEDPRYPGAYMAVADLVYRDARGKPARSQHAIRPRPGLLVMFPGWLRHSVRPFQGGGARVSVALNLSLFPVG
ncbi:MAG: TIGR02466 family protein [Pseudomonadota bacterium]